MRRWSPPGDGATIEQDERAADARTRVLTRALALLSITPGVLSVARSGLHDSSSDTTVALIALFALAYVVLYVAIPWRRLPRDLFAFHAIAGAVFVAIIVARTGGAASPFIVNFFLAVVFAALYYRLTIALLVTAVVGALSLALTIGPGGLALTPPESVSRVAVFFCLTVIINRTSRQLRRLARRQREAEADFAALRQESQDLRRRASELDILNRVATARGFDPSTLLATAVRDVREALDVDYAAVMLYDATTGDGAIAALHNAFTEEKGIGAIFPVRGTPLEPLLRAGLPVVANDVSTDPRFVGVPVVVGAVAALLAPLARHDGALGALLIATTDARRAFSDAEAQFAATLGNTLGAALSRMRTGHEERRATNYVETLNTIIAAATTHERPAALGRDAIAALADALGMDGGALFLLDHDGLHLRLAASQEIPGASRSIDAVIPLAAPRLLTETVTSGRPAFSGSAIALPAATATALALDNARGYAMAPLMARGRVVGVLAVLGQDDRAFTEDEQDLVCTAATTVALALDNARLYASTERAMVETIEALAGAIEARDGYTGEHCEHMAERAIALATALNLSPEEIATIRLGAALHDVGKIGIPDAILNKPGRLDDAEFTVMKRHPEIGARIVGAVEQLRVVVPLVRHHHERYNGTGYPDALRGEDIPIGARVLAVVDAYGAMTEDRVYRQAPGHERAIAEIERGAGAHFDPHVARTFLRLQQTPHPDTSAGVVLPPVLSAGARDARQGGALRPAERHAHVRGLVARDMLLSPDTSTEEALALFERDSERLAVAVGSEGVARAIVTRQGLLTKLSGLYGNAIYRQRPVARVANEAMLVVDGATPLEEAVRQATARSSERRYDPIVVTEGGYYSGLVAVSQLLDHLNDEALRRARLSNPLSGLPGAPLLETEINNRVSAGAPTAFILADIDGFKAYNDHYGLARGDDVLLMAATVLRDVAADVGQGAFVGHVGGDDFVLLAHPDRVEPLHARITARFNAAISRYYDAADLSHGGLSSDDRSGRRRFYPIASMSVAAVATNEVDSPTYLRLTEEATRRKTAIKRAKAACVA